MRSRVFGALGFRLIEFGSGLIIFINFSGIALFTTMCFCRSLFSLSYIIYFSEKRNEEKTIIQGNS